MSHTQKAFALLVTSDVDAVSSLSGVSGILLDLRTRHYLMDRSPPPKLPKIESLQRAFAIFAVDSQPKSWKASLVKHYKGFQEVHRKQVWTPYTSENERDGDVVTQFCC